MILSNPQKGSALFYVLIGVVLFAALSFAVAGMMRGGNTDVMSNEKSGLYADEILNYGRALRQAAQTIKISGRCQDLDISFEDPSLAGYTHVPAVDDNCKMFKDTGGGINYLAPPDVALDLSVSPAPALRGAWYFAANVCAPGTGTASTGCDSDGTDNEALIAFLPYVHKDVCKRINERLGITAADADPPQETGNAWPAAETKFTGTMTDGVSLDESGMMAGCFEGAAGSAPAAGTYHFFQVLLPR